MRSILTLALPFVFLVVPLAAGFHCSAIGPEVPPLPSLEAYDGRRPTLPVTIESYGAGVVVVPFRAHLRASVLQGQLPLWNPNAGLGQPLAAQGEGSPYAPLALLRALLPAGILVEIPARSSEVTGTYLGSNRPVPGASRSPNATPMTARCSEGYAAGLVRL